ncbi:hypothetical protein F5H01DRAFT_335694 [Linnemannia elongata]|nr:hypothetical protein F5H01DRAFT_335694 [Linnemannia elongata]
MTPSPPTTTASETKRLLNHPFRSRRHFWKSTPPPLAPTALLACRSSSHLFRSLPITLITTTTVIGPATLVVVGMGLGRHLVRVRLRCRSRHRGGLLLVPIPVVLRLVVLLLLLLLAFLALVLVFPLLLLTPTLGRRAPHLYLPGVITIPPPGVMLPSLLRNSSRPPPSPSMRSPSPPLPLSPPPPPPPPTTTTTTVDSICSL